MATATAPANVALVPSEKAEKADNLDLICRESRRALAQADGDFRKGLVLARGIQSLREHLTDDIMDDVMKLSGTKLGFRTDRDRGGAKKYEMTEIRDVVIEAMLRGCRITGNEFNVIAGGFYLTKEGLERMTDDWPGVYNVRHRPGVPHINGKSALVDYVLSWEIHTFDDDGELTDIRKEEIRALKTEEMDERVPVRVNEGQGPDAVIGKARRKMLARMHDFLSGKRSSGHHEMSDVIDVESKAEKSTLPPAESHFAELNELGEVNRKLAELLGEYDDNPTYKRELEAAAIERNKHIKSTRGENSNQ